MLHGCDGLPAIPASEDTGKVFENRINPASYNSVSASSGFDSETLPPRIK